MIMNPRVQKVKPLDDFKLFIVFENGEERFFDVKPYLNKGIFTELRALNKFNSAHVAEGTVQWENEADFCPDTLFEDSVPYKKQTN
jgi:hypothetical protein